MDCLRPVFAYDLGVKPNGKHDIRFKVKLPLEPNIVLPCGKCDACRDNKRKSWINRCNIELLSHPQSSFLTLTFNEDNCPKSVCKRDLQLFFKRLRNFRRDFYHDKTMLDFRYFAVGEYGHLHHRPHYHAIVFGVDFLSPEYKPYLVGLKDGFPLWSSKVLERYWPFGFVTVDEVTPRNVRYVAKYVSKSSDGVCLFSQGLGRSVFVDFARSGRVVHISPKGQLRAFALTDKFCDVIGKPPKCLPRFALRYVERFYPDLFERLKCRRRDFLRGRRDETACPSIRQASLIEKLLMENEKRSYEKYN